MVVRQGEMSEQFDPQQGDARVQNQQRAQVHEEGLVT